MEKQCAQCGESFGKPSTSSRAAWERRLYCSRKCQYDAMRGRKNAKLGDHLRGKQQDPQVAAKRIANIRRTYEAGGVQHARANAGVRREQASQWRGDSIRYRAAHVRLNVLRGKAREHACALCGKPAHEWALREDARAVRLEKGGRFDGKSFSTSADDYLPMCRPCHRAYDGRARDPTTGRYL